MEVIMDLIFQHTLESLDSISMLGIGLVGIWVVVREIRKNQERLHSRFKEHEKTIAHSIESIRIEFRLEIEAMKAHSKEIEKKHTRALERLHKRVLSIEINHASDEKMS